MTDILVLDLAKKALTLGLELCAPVLGLSLTVGLGVSVFQAATQIQEMTLSFVPKLLALVGALVVLGPWMLKLATTFTANLLTELPNYIK